MKYYHDKEKNQHWYFSDNANCPGLMIDKSGGQNLTSIVGKVVDMTPAIFQDLMLLIMDANMHELEGLSTEDLIQIKASYNQNSSHDRDKMSDKDLYDALTNQHNATFDILIHGKRHLTDE